MTRIYIEVISSQNDYFCYPLIQSFLFLFIQSGLLSALPYFLMWVFTIICGALATYVRSKDVSSEIIRKSFNTLGHIAPALGLVGLSFSGCDSRLVMFWFCLSVMLNGASNSGFQVNHAELTSNYAGTLMGVTNTAANMAGFMAPYVTGLVIDGNVSTYIITLFKCFD